MPASFDSLEPEPAAPRPAHRVGLLDVGSEALVARIHLIRSAKKSIKLQTFIWANDIPYFCLHSKSMVIDDELSAIGSYNLDPRSANLNTEAVLLIADRAFAKELVRSIRRDIRPRNSWIVWRRQRGPAARLFGGVLADVGRAEANAGGTDLWPENDASCFALKPGAQPVPPGHKSFYDNYEAVGSFPWVPAGSEKRVCSRLIQAVGEFETPLL